MAGTPRTKEKWDKLVAAFREKPGNASYAGREAGVDPRSAKRAWDLGWLELKRERYAARAIKDLLLDEKIAARAKLEMERQAKEAEEAERDRSIRDERVKGREDAVNQKAAEARATRAALNSGTGLLGMSGQLATGCLPLIALVTRKLATETVQTVKPLEMIELFRKIAWISFVATRIIDHAMRLERLHVGDPEQIIGVHAEPTEAFSLEKALAHVGGTGQYDKAVRDLLDGNVGPEAQRLLDSMTVIGLPPMEAKLPS